MKLLNGRLVVLILLAVATAGCGRDLPGEEPLEPGDDTIVEDAPTPALQARR